MVSEVIYGYFQFRQTLYLLLDTLVGVTIYIYSFQVPEATWYQLIMHKASCILSHCLSSQLKSDLPFRDACHLTHTLTEEVERTT